MALLASDVLVDAGLCSFEASPAPASALSRNAANQLRAAGPVIPCASDIEAELRLIITLVLMPCTAAESSEAVKSELNAERRILAMAAAL